MWGDLFYLGAATLERDFPEGLMTEEEQAGKEFMDTIIYAPIQWAIRGVAGAYLFSVIVWGV